MILIQGKTHLQNGVLLGFLCLTYSVPAVADDDAAMLDGLPTIISATRLPQPMLHSPVSATVIDREMIRMSGYTHIGDLFRLVPGFQVAMASGGHYVVTYHGQEITFPMRIEVLVDGRSVYDNLLSSIKWNAIGVEMDDIELIEVIRGPNAPVFGSNALVATINITTRAPYEEQGTWLNTVAGSQDTRKMQLRHTDSVGDLDYSVSLGYREDSGFDSEPFHPHAYDSTALSNFRLRGYYPINNTDNLDFQFGYVGGEGPTALSRLDLPLVDHDGDLTSWFQQFRWSRSTDKAESSVQAYVNHLNQSDEFTSAPLTQIFGVSEEYLQETFGVNDQLLSFPYADGSSDRSDIEFQHLMKNRPWGQWVWGVGARFDALETPHVFPVTRDTNISGRVFSNAEFVLPGDLFLNVGGMLEHNELVQWHGSSRIALNYSINDSQSLRASYSSTQRSPSIMDENFNSGLRLDDGFVISPVLSSPGDIDTEKLNAWEIGYSAMFRSINLFMDVKVFREEGRDLIGYAYDTTVPNLLTGKGVEILHNNDKFDIDGIEGQVTWRPRRGGIVSLSYLFSDSEKTRLIRLPDVVKKQDDITAERIISLLISWPLGDGYSVGANYYHMTDLDWTWDGGDPPAYHRWDARVSKDFQWGGHDVQLDFVAQSIDNEYIEYSEDTIFKPRYYAKMGFKF